MSPPERSARGQQRPNDPWISTSLRRGWCSSRVVPVGLGPVAVAAEINGEVWVLNHLSDKRQRGDAHLHRMSCALFCGATSLANIVSQDPRVPRPSSPLRIAAKSNAPILLNPGVEGAGDPQLLPPVFRASAVWVFDHCSSRQTTMGGTPVRIRLSSPIRRRAHASAPVSIRFLWLLQDPSTRPIDRERGPDMHRFNHQTAWRAERSSLVSPAAICPATDALASRRRK